MARARNIKPGLYKNEDLAECSIWARYIFPGLWMLADRDGLLEDRPKRIKGELLPFDAQDVEPLLAELASRKDAQGVPFIVRYRNSAGSFIQVSKFQTHQTPHYSEKESVIEPPPLQEKDGMNGGNSGSAPPIMPAGLQEDSKKSPPIKRGSQPPDSLIHRLSDSPTADSHDSPTPDTGGKSTASARASRLPADWVLPRPWGEWALRERPDWNPDAVRKVADQFRDHWIAKPGKDGRKADWLATWRNWVRREPTARVGSTRNQGSQFERNLDAVKDWTPPEERREPHT